MYLLRYVGNSSNPEEDARPDPFHRPVNPNLPIVYDTILLNDSYGGIADFYKTFQRNNRSTYGN